MEVITKSAQETKELGRKIATNLVDKSKNSSDSVVLALSGGLGAGKTTFVQGFAEGLEIKARLISPTFIIMRNYEVEHKTSPYKNFYHVDLYRLDENMESELSNLGIIDAWQNPENIFLIEWADKARNVIPDGAIWIKFKNIEGDERVIEIEDNEILI